jgi:DNA-directed RNA polymerase subunit RPC12/RpoP
MDNSSKSLFKEKQKKQLSDIFDSERETIERKKCMKCLRSVKIDYLKCPYCGSTNFYGY